MSQRTFRTRPPLQALVVEQALLLAQQLGRTADAAPDGRVLSRVEALAVPAAREVARQAVQAAPQARAEAAEKEGRRAAPAPAGGGRGTKGGPAAPS